MHVNNPLLARPEPPHERAGLGTSTPDRSTFRALLGRSRSRDGGRCLFHPGSATRGVQTGFATCLLLFILGYAALAGLGWAPTSSQSTTPEVALERAPCSYGSLPGFWTPVANNSVGNWTVFEESCQLEDLVSRHLEYATNASESVEDTGILLLGDSADRNLIFDFCSAAGHEVQPFNINITEHGWKTCNRGDEWGTYKDVVNCNTCRVPGLRVTKESIWGFFETRTPEDREGLPLERTQQGLEQFKEEHGRYPDLVVLHSNYWDIAQIVLFRWWEAWEPEYVALMRDWLERADKAARFLEEKAAETGMLLAYRTVQYPQILNCSESGKAYDHQIGYRYHVTYLNSAGRQLARKRNMFLVDVEMMFQKFWSTKEFLSDNHHLNADANKQLLNVYLNLLRNKPLPKQAQEHARHSLRPALGKGAGIDVTAVRAM